MTPALYVGGEQRHGVVRLARDLASAVQELEPATEVVAHPPAGGSLHVHFTDRLWGDSPEAAADAIAEIGRRLTLTVTLHDVPQPSDGAGRFTRRRDCYRAVADASVAVACSSHHEMALLRETGVLAPDGAAPAVIPLPAAAPRSPAPSRVTPADPPTVALLGWIYPGKGHREAIEAATGLDGVAVTALGAAARGHADDLEELVRLAAARDVAFHATGYLDDATLVRRCRTATVPLAGHTHLSASGSINAWIAAGRRPLVAAGRYTREIDALRPNTVTLHAPGRLREAIAAALADPKRTWLAPGTDTRPHLAETAQDYLRWWRG